MIGSSAGVNGFLILGNGRFEESGIATRVRVVGAAWLVRQIGLRAMNHSLAYLSSRKRYTWDRLTVIFRKCCLLSVDDPMSIPQSCQRTDRTRMGTNL